MSNTEDRVYRIGDHVTQNGYPCLIRAVDICLELESVPHRRIIQLVYKPIAEEMGMSPDRVNRAICRATKDIWDKRSHKELDALIGQHLDDKPAPRELIFYLFQYLKEN